MFRVVYLKHCTPRIHIRYISSSASSRIFIKFTLPKNLIKTHKIYSECHARLHLECCWWYSFLHERNEGSHPRRVASKQEQQKPKKRIIHKNRQTGDEKGSEAGMYDTPGIRASARWCIINYGHNQAIAITVYEQQYIRPTIIICLS